LGSDTAHSFKTLATQLTFTQCRHHKTGLTLLFYLEGENYLPLLHASYIFLPDKEPFLWRLQCTPFLAQQLYIIIIFIECLGVLCVEGVCWRRYV